MFISASLQEKQFSELIKSKQLVDVYLQNGKKYQGTLLSVTQDLVFIHTPGLETIRRNQIKTVIPVVSK